MIIKGKQYNKVSEKTVDGVVFKMYRSDEDKRGSGLDDVVVLSHNEGEEIDLGFISKTTIKRGLKKAKHRELKVESKDWDNIHTL